MCHKSVNPQNMDDDHKTQNMEKGVSRQPISNIFNVGFIFQSIRIRRNSIFSDIVNRKFIESQPRYVFYCGSLFWILYILSKAF